MSKIFVTNIGGIHSFYDDALHFDKIKTIEKDKDGQDIDVFTNVSTIPAEAFEISKSDYDDFLSNQREYSFVDGVLTFTASPILPEKVSEIEALIALLISQNIIKQVDLDSEKIKDKIK